MRYTTKTLIKLGYAVKQTETGFIATFGDSSIEGISGVYIVKNRGNSVRFRSIKEAHKYLRG